MVKSSEQEATHYIKIFVVYIYEKEIGFEGFFYKNNVVSGRSYNVE
jgi:hypothetical protein